LRTETPGQVRALGMVSRDTQRVILLEGLEQLVGTLHVGVVVLLERLLTELCELIGGGKHSSPLSDCIAPAQLADRMCDVVMVFGWPEPVGCPAHYAPVSD
jgi:hypothetical protein